MDASFDEFVRTQSPGLSRLALAMAGNQHDAGDLLQETLVRMGERWTPGRFDEPTAYAVTVMARLNVDRIRRWRREIPSAAPRPDLVPVAVTTDAPWLLPALATLSPRQRTALALRFVEDLDVRGIAERLGCAEGTARSHLSRGLARLQAAAPPRTTRPTTRSDG